MNSRYELGQSLLRAGRASKKKFAAALDRKLAPLGAALRRGKGKASQVHAATQNALLGFDAEAEQLLTGARQLARDAANLALAGVAIGVATNVALRDDESRAAKYAAVLLDNLKVAVATAALSWVTSGSRRSFTQALRSDRSVGALVERTLVTENADAFNSQLRAVANRNGDGLDWVWDAHLEACHICVARHGRPLSVTGWPPAHPHCNCFGSPFTASRKQVVGTAARGSEPTVPWRPNPDGQATTLDRVPDLLKRAKVRTDWDSHLDDFGKPMPIHFTVGDLPKRVHATYGPLIGPGESGAALRRLEPNHPDWVHLTGRLHVTIAQHTMERGDDAVIAAVAHEMHEMQLLQAAIERRAAAGLRPFDQNGVSSLVNAHDGSFHLQAWIHADDVVARYQAAFPYDGD